MTAKSFIPLALVVLEGVGTALAAEPASTDLWWQSEQTVIATLMKRDLIELVTRKETHEPCADPAELLRRLSLFVRAGHRQDARGIGWQLAEVRARLPRRAVQDAVMFLLGREEWDLARVFLEIFPDTEAGWTHLLLEHWKRQGKSVDEIDAWIRDRQPANPAHWVKMRIRLRAQTGTEGELLQALADDVRAHPEDPARVFLYLEASSHKKQPPEWIAEAFRPKRALDAYEVGSSLVDRAPRAAVALLERALALELSAEEVEQASSSVQRVMIGVDAHAMIRGWFRSALVNAYQRAGQHEKAQKLMERIVDEAGGKPVSPYMARVAGQVQAASGARVIEQRIRRAEPENKGSPRYWLSRANYYAGRKAHAEARRAYDKALKLAPVSRKRFFKVADVRSEILFSYWRYLVGNRRIAEADRLLHRELDQLPPDSPTASRAAHAIYMLDVDHHHPLSPDDPVLWRFLGQRKRWDHTDEGILWKLLERTPRAKRKKAYARVTRLTRRKHPTRAKTLGWILTRMGESRRAIPLLKDAVGRLAEKDDLDSARFALLEAYLKAGDWRAAEDLFPEASKQLTCKELTSWYADIAVQAARAGAKDDALRIWKRVSNLDLADLSHLSEIAAAGMGDRLAAYYRGLAKRDRQSWVPGRALEMLR